MDKPESSNWDSACESAETPSALSEFVSSAFQTAGNFLADNVSIDHELDPDVRRMLRDFGLVMQDAAQAVVPQPPATPGFDDGKQFSAIGRPREALQNAGIDPDDLGGISIGVLDSHVAQGAEVPHGGMVSAVIADGEYGLSHNANVIALDSSPLKNPAFDEAVDNPTSSNLGSVISGWAAGAVDSTTGDINNATMIAGESNMRVLNLSEGLSNVELTQGLFDTMLKNPEKYRPWLEQLVGKESADRWIAAGDVKHNSAETQDPDQSVYQAILNRVDAELSSNPTFDAAMHRYREATRHAADSGLTIVVAVGNAQQSLQNFGINITDGAAYNYFAQSDHVIAAGASDLNGTPGRNSDDYVAPFSAHGTARFHPTVVAHGSRVSSRWDAMDGTSFAAPLVSGTIGLMLAQDPSLSFQEIRKLLADNSSRLSRDPITSQGAGELNVDQAVLAARSRRQQSH